MPVTDLPTWIEEYGREGTLWCAKRLSANDTLATESHQAGPYMPRAFIFDVLPGLERRAVKNPDTRINFFIDSHSDHREIRIIWYNNKFHKNPETGLYGSRNEIHMTGFGGMESALLDPDSTGAIAVFVFIFGEQREAHECHVWVCDNKLEEDLVEQRIGAVDPKTFVVWKPGIEHGYLTASVTGAASCRLTHDRIPASWLEKFPTGEDIVEFTRKLRPDLGLPVDDRLIRRRNCEYEIFRSIEEAVYTEQINAGFTSTDQFITLAQTMLQSRKSRSGTSLELHARDIFKEEALVPGKHFTHRPVIEGGKRPDFIFPSIEAYNDPAFSPQRLRILAVKTTCKDRWRQVLNEANRIQNKHLLTLQDGVSENQFAEMNEAGIKLVVPNKLHDAFPESVRGHLISFESFIADVRMLNIET